jgi:hypothetical protein
MGNSLPSHANLVHHRFAPKLRPDDGLGRDLGFNKKFALAIQPPDRLLCLDNGAGLG